MSIKHFLKTTNTKSLITLLMALQLVACGIEEAAVQDTTNTTANSNLSPTGSVTLNWTAPVAREDESPLSMSEISGFRIHLGTTRGDYPQKIDIDDAYADQVTLNDAILSPGRQYLVMTTIDRDGRESDYSAEVILDI